MHHDKSSGIRLHAVYRLSQEDLDLFPPFDPPLGGQAHSQPVASGGRSR